MNVNFREFRPEDFEILVMLDHEAYRPEMKFSESQMKKLLSDNDVVCFIVENEVSDVIGAVIIKLIKFEHLLRIISITINQKYRRKGIGTLILDNTVKIARYMKVTRIESQVELENTPAIHTFRKFGFEIEKEYENFIIDGNKGCLMALNVSAAEPAKETE